VVVCPAVTPVFSVHAAIAFVFIFPAFSTVFVTVITIMITVSPVAAVIIVAVFCITISAIVKSISDGYAGKDNLALNNNMGPGITTAILSHGNGCNEKGGSNEERNLSFHTTFFLR
jgi:tetrahydromethanopterin S-methyltransferase subunit E